MTWQTSLLLRFFSPFWGWCVSPSLSGLPPQLSWFDPRRPWGFRPGKPPLGTPALFLRRLASPVSPPYTVVWSGFLASLDLLGFGLRVSACVAVVLRAFSFASLRFAVVGLRVFCVCFAQLLLLLRRGRHFPRVWSACRLLCLFVPGGGNQMESSRFLLLAPPLKDTHSSS